MRPFRCPWVPFVPIMGVLTCLLLMFSLPAENWWRLGVWLAIGFLIYFGYGRRHSAMRITPADRRSRSAGFQPARPRETSAPLTLRGSLKGGGP